jgi:hypothetical protein
MTGDESSTTPGHPKAELNSWKPIIFAVALILSLLVLMIPESSVSIGNTSLVMLVQALLEFLCRCSSHLLRRTRESSGGTTFVLTLGAP